MSIDDIFDKFHAENAINILKKDKTAISFTNLAIFLTKSIQNITLTFLNKIKYLIQKNF